jgi:hypothetical protein
MPGSGDEEIRTSHLNWIASLSLAMTKCSSGVSLDHSLGGSQSRADPRGA